MQRPLPVLLGLGLLAVLVFLARDLADAPGGATPSPTGGASPIEESSTPSLAEATRPSASSSATDSDERAPAVAEPGGRVRPGVGSFTGNPEVRALPLRGPRRELWVQPPTQAARVTGERYTFDPGPLLNGDVAVVATHPQHLAAGALHKADTPLPDLVLEPGPETRVEVTGVQDVPAHVQLSADLPLEGGGAQRVVLRFPAGDPLPLFPGTFTLRASDGVRVSEPWTGTLEDADGRVQLELKDTFTVRGAVQGEATDGLAVTVRAALAPWEGALAAAAVVDGGFELDAVPWLGEGPYRLRLEGPGCATLERPFDVAAPGDVVDLDLEVEPGIPAAFRTVDAEGEPVAEVEVLLFWWGGDAWVTDSRRTTDDLGLVRFEDTKRGTVGVRTKAPGYVNMPHGTWELLAPRPEPLVLALSPAGSISGRVLRSGEPAQDFDVQAATAGTRSKNQVVESFRAREDGTFRIEGMAPGRVELTAFTDEVPPGPVVVVELVAGVEVTAELELVEGRVISGTVLDISTGQPIAGAQVQPWTTTTERAALGAWGVPGRTGPDGRFEGLLVPSANLLLVVEAEGYGRLLEYGPAIRASNDEVPPMGLAPLQPLDVYLEADAGTDLTEYRVQVEVRTRGEAVRMDASGHLRFPAVEPGIGRVYVYPPNGGSFQQDVSLVSGQDWSVRIPIVTGKAVTARVRPASGVVLPDVLWVNAVFESTAEAPYTMFAKVDEAGAAEFACARGAEAMFEVVSSDGRRWATRTAELDEDRTVVDIHVRDEAYRFRLERADGEPVRSAFVSHWTTGNALGYHHNLWADDAGEFVVRDPGTESLTLVVSARGCLAPARTLGLSGRDPSETIVLVYDADASVVVELTESSGPAMGLRVDLYPPASDGATWTRTSDEGGRVRFDDLVAGEFELLVQGAGWWTEVVRVTATADPAPVRLAMRRRGALEVEVTRGGLPVAGAEVRVASRVEGEDLTHWLETNRISISASDWRTASDGTLTLDGLPAGTYDMYVPLPDGSLTGKVEVTASSLARVRLELGG